jgi:hypothetical protein
MDNQIIIFGGLSNSLSLDKMAENVRNDYLKRALLMINCRMFSLPYLYEIEKYERLPQRELNPEMSAKIIIIY